MGKIVITQVRSAINRTKRQKETIKALGLKNSTTQWNTKTPPKSWAWCAPWVTW